MKKVFLLTLCVALSVCIFGCGDEATVSYSDVKYNDTAVVTMQELQTVANNDDTIEIWCCTSSIDRTKPDTKLTVEKIEVSGAYARLILDKIKVLTAQGDLEVADRSANPKRNDIWIRLLDGSLYSVSDFGVTKVKDIYSTGQTMLATKALKPILKQVFKYYGGNANYYDVHYDEGTVNIEHAFNNLTDVTLTVKDMYYTEKAETISVTVEAVSKVDREIGLQIRYSGEGYPAADNAVSLKKDVPKTVVLEFEPSTKTKWFTLECEGNIYNFKPNIVTTEVMP